MVYDPLDRIDSEEYYSKNNQTLHTLHTVATLKEMILSKQVYTKGDSLQPAFSD